MVGLKNNPKHELTSLDSCPLCGGDIKKKYSAIKDRLDTTPDTFNVYECADCQAGFLNPMPVGDLSQFYPVNYLSAEDHTAAAAGPRLDLEKWYRYNQYRYDFGLLKKATGLAVKDIVSYLDIGCGSGERVTFASERGCKNSFGVDKLDFAKNRSKRKASIINSEILDFTPQKKFQVASLFHVLEHIVNPEAILAHIKDNLLTKRAYLIVQVPNYASLERRLFGARWFGLDVPRHLWQFNEQALRRLLERTAFKVQAAYRLNAPLHPVSFVPSLFPDLDIQRIWIDPSHGPVYGQMMKMLWAASTAFFIPLNMLQNAINDSTMLTVIASSE